MSPDRGVFERFDRARRRAAPAEPVYVGYDAALELQRGGQNVLAMNALGRVVILPQLSIPGAGSWIFTDKDIL